MFVPDYPVYMIHVYFNTPLDKSSFDLVKQPE